MKNKPASSFVVPFATTLSEITHLGVADRWLETPIKPESHGANLQAANIRS